MYIRNCFRKKTGVVFLHVCGPMLSGAHTFTEFIPMTFEKFKEIFLHRKKSTAGAAGSIPICVR